MPFRESGRGGRNVSSQPSAGVEPEELGDTPDHDAGRVGIGHVEAKPDRAHACQAVKDMELVGKAEDEPAHEAPQEPDDDNATFAPGGVAEDRARATGEEGPAMSPLGQALGVVLGQVSPDRHPGDVEVARRVASCDLMVVLDRLMDLTMALALQHGDGKRFWKRRRKPRTCSLPRHNMDFRAHCQQTAWKCTSAPLDPWSVGRRSRLLPRAQQEVYAVFPTSLFARTTAPCASSA
jgi:hypothetical protein